MRNKYLLSLVFPGLLVLAACGKSANLQDDPPDGLATGEVKIEYSNGYFTGGSFREPGKYIYFLSQKGTENVPSNYSHLVYLRAKGGTQRSGETDAYTWKVSGLPSWLVLKKLGSYYALTQADDPNNAGQKLFPEEYTAGQVIQIVVDTPGSGYTTASITFTGDGYNASANVVPSGGKIVDSGITILEPGFGYTTAPAVTINGNGNGATAHAVISTPTPISITATSDEGKTTTVQTTILVLNNRQTGSGTYQYLNMQNAYSGTNVLTSAEIASDNDTTASYTEKNGSCKYDSTREYQAMIPGQTILANAGKSGRDCYAFFVPTKDYRVSFTITAKTSTTNINDCKSGTDVTKCGYVLEVKEFPATISSSVLTETSNTGFYFLIPTSTTSINTPIGFVGNSQYNPTLQDVNSLPPTWRLSNFFYPTNAIPASSVNNILLKCDPNASWTTNFENETYCKSNPGNPNNPWYSGAGWYFVIVDSTQAQGGDYAQPYTIEMEADLN